MSESKYKFQFEIWENYVDKIGEMIFNNDYQISKIFKKDEENYKKFAENYEENFIKYKIKNRFAIPIIGKISSGKSTFLNSILFGDYLSSSSDINTKFICILRNNSNLKSPKFFECELKLEKLNYKYKDIKYYYFEKGEEIEGNILESIKKINADLKNYEENVEIELRDINKYFYILELNIPLFNQNEELGNYFDLMDIPGLNEKNDFYIERVIPILVNKCLFSIYIFDMSHYENNDSSDIYIKYSKQLNKFYKNNSIFILNKIDEISENDKKNYKDADYYFNKFKKYLEEGFKVNMETNSFLKLNSKELYNKVNAFSNLKTFISYIIDSINIEEVDELFSVLEYIKHNFTKYFQINEEELEKIYNKDDNEYKEYFDEKEFEEITKNINSNEKDLNSDIQESDYTKLNYIFKNKNKIFLSIEYLNTVYEKMIESMNKSLDEFFNWDNVLDLFTAFKDSINKTFEGKIEKENYIKICEDLLESFKKELERRKGLKNSITKYNIKAIEPLKKIIDKLLELDKGNESLIKLKENFNSLTYFIYNNRKIRIPLLGAYSTGKSSFLNSLIGKDILPVDISICTNRGIIVRHNKNKDLPQLFKTKFIKTENPEYWYFEEEKTPICEGYEEIKSKLIELNKEKPEFEDAFIVLKIDLNLFSELDFYKNSNLKSILEDKLELIDFPGLDVKKDFYKKKIFTPLMRFSDGFIFINECDLIMESGNIQILISILNEIKSRKFSFSYTSCLFLLHKLDKSLDLNLEESKKKFVNLFEKDETDNKKLNDIKNLNVEKFSSKLYHFYIEFASKYIKDFQSFLKFIAENLIKPQDKNKIKNYQAFLNLINNIIKKLKFHINKKSIKNNDIKIKESDLTKKDDVLKQIFKTLKLGQDINDKKIENNEISKIVKEIYSNYLYIFKNQKFQNKRLLSNANSLFKSLYRLFDDSYNYTENEFNKYFGLFIKNFNDLFILIDLKIFGIQFNKQLDFDSINKKNENLRKKTNDLYNESKKYIEDEKSKLFNENEKIKNDFFSKYNNDKNENNSKNYIKIENKIQNNINDFSEKINQQIIKFNKIIKELDLNNNIVKEININYSEVKLNKDSRIKQNYIYEDNNGFINFFKGIANVGISIKNWWNEKQKIENNFNDYFSNISDLINNFQETYNSQIKSIKNSIVNKIDDDLRNNNNNFEGIKNHREEYKVIKAEYIKILELIKN